jgi:hypothetical protein
VLHLAARPRWKEEDPLTLLKEQLAFQKALEQGAPRNARLLPAGAATDDSEPAQPQSWVDVLKPLAPVAATGLQEAIVGAFAKDDPQRASEIRRNFSAYANAFGAMQNQLAKEGVGAPVPGFLPFVADPEERVPRSRAVGEVLAQLDDNEAERFETFIDGLDVAGVGRLNDEASALKLDQRIGCGRGDFSPRRAAHHRRNFTRRRAAVPRRNPPARAYCSRAVAPAAS